MCVCECRLCPSKCKSMADVFAEVPRPLHSDLLYLSSLSHHLVPRSADLITLGHCGQLANSLLHCLPAEINWIEWPQLRLKYAIFPFSHLQPSPSLSTRPAHMCFSQFFFRFCCCFWLFYKQRKIVVKTKGEIMWKFFRRAINIGVFLSVPFFTIALPLSLFLHKLNNK